MLNNAYFEIIVFYYLIKYFNNSIRRTGISGEVLVRWHITSSAFLKALESQDKFLGWKKK